MYSLVLVFLPDAPGASASTNVDIFPSQDFSLQYWKVENQNSNLYLLKFTTHDDLLQMTPVRNVFLSQC